MSIGQTPSGIRIVKETLKASEIAIPLYQVVAAAGEHSNQITVEYNNFAKGRNKPQIFCADQQAVFVQLVSPARFGATHVHSQRLIPMATIALQKWLGAILFLDPNPVAMRGYSYRSELRMQGDGANVSAVLHDLCETQGRTSTGFNGAAALRGGRPRTYASCERGDGRLQWGRRSTRRKTRQVREADGGRLRASMGPPLYAAEDSTRVCCCRSICFQASMGPPLYAAEDGGALGGRARVPARFNGAAALRGGRRH